MSELKENTFSIMQMAKDNDDYRRVLKTGELAQVVLMSIPAGEEIGNEVHEGHDQILIFVEGSGVATIGNDETAVNEGDLSFVPSGAYHNFRNTGSGPLKLYTMYSPPEHEEGTEQHTKADADSHHH